MRPTRGWIVGIALFALVVQAALTPLLLTSESLPFPGVWVVVNVLVTGGFVAAGLLAWERRPGNRTGLLMVLVGLLLPLGFAQGVDNAWIFAVGNVFGVAFVAAAIHLLLAFPTGELRDRWDRLTVWGGYVLTTVGFLPFVLFTSTEEAGCAECPDNVLLIAEVPTITTVTIVIAGLLTAIAVLATGYELVRRWRAATGPQARGVRPVLGAGVILMAMLALSLALGVAGVSGRVYDVVVIGGLIAFSLTPYMFLAGLARSSLARGGAVSDLLGRLAEQPRRGELRDALARALGDDSLMLAYWLPTTASYVDVRGHPVRLPPPGGDRAVSHVERDGRRVATIVYDAALAEDDPGLVDAVGSAASIALENERLDAELCARVEELRGSRMRLMEVGMAERRGLERNLHDGAQQRLVSLALTLRAARTRLGGSEDGAGELLDRAELELELAISELRELARGIHPAVLSDRGLPAALESLAVRSPVPVEVGVLPAERLPEPVELAAYYVISEALANVVKYAGATHATVDVARSNGDVLVEVGDDGVGGADPARGTGLRGLQDRVRALEGRLAVVSESGQGTRVKARIPCG